MNSEFKKAGLKLILVAVTVLSMAGCGEQSTQESEDCAAAISASGYLASGDCRILSWGNNLPITLTIEDSLPQDVKLAIYDAVDIWEQATELDLFEIQTTTIATQSRITHEYNLVGLRSGSLWSDQPIGGLTDEPAKTVYYYTQQLFNTNIFFNEDYVNGSRGNYDFLSIALHEIGHTLGLDHDNSSDPNKSIMNAKIDPNEQRQLTERDINRVRALYAFF